VSVIIPCYRHFDYLAEAIGSVLDQDYRHCEILVVDDGSPESPRAVVAPFRGVRLVHQPHQGAAAARNFGLRQTAGEFLVFLDADDRLLPGALRSGIEAMSTSGHIGMVFGNLQVIGPDQATTPYRQPAPRPVGATSYQALLERNIIGPPIATMFRRSALEAIGGFDQSIQFAEDYDLYLRVAERFAVVGHPHVVGQYRRHPNQVSSRLREMVRWHLAVLDRHFARHPGEPTVRKAIREGRRYCHRTLHSYQLLEELTVAVRTGQTAAALATGLHLLVRYPGRFLENLVRKLGRLVRVSRPAPGAPGQ